jgi:Helicase conserved C-terminal domain
LVLDEAHQILSDAEFRPQFLKLRELADFTVQKIYLTASLPKRLETRFLAQACLPPDTVIIRAPSDQPHISYVKLTYNTMNTNVIRLAVDVAQIMSGVIGPTRKGIIFCSTIDEAEELGLKFTQKCVSHSKLGYDIKAENEEKWKAGHCQWIAATTGMICGIDDPNVGAIIFLGLSYGLVNIYQGAGRSGRDGTPSWAIVLQSSNTYKALPKGGMKDGDPQCMEECHEWLHSQECRRIGFSKLFDAAQVSCLDLPNSHLCDFCEPDLDLFSTLQSKIIDPPIQRKPEEDYEALDSYLMNIDFDGIFELTGPPAPTLDQPSSSSSLQPTLSTLGLPASSSSSDPFHFAPSPGPPSMHIQRQAAYYQASLMTKEGKSKVLNAFTTKLLGMCPLCWAYRGVLEPRHKDGQWIKCRGSQAKGYMNLGMDRSFKKRIKFPPYKFCWKCHLPQDDFMPPSHPDFKSGNRGSKDCPHEDFVVQLVIFIHQDQEWWRRACEAFGLASNMSESELVKWYTAEDTQGGFNNSLELILWFYLEKERERK